MDMNDNKGAKTYILVILIFLLLVMFIVNESTYIKIDNSSITIEKYPSVTEHRDISNYENTWPGGKSRYFNGGLYDYNITR